MQLKKKLGQITESDSLNELLKRVLDLSQEVLQSEAATLFLVDHTTDELVFKIVNGPASKELQGKRIKIGEGIAGRTAREGKSFVVNRPRDSGYADKFDKQTGFSTESLLAAPLIVDGETIGVIEVINSKGGDYTERSKQIIEQLAAQVSSGLKMALLSERLSKSEEFLNSVINSLPGGIIILDKKGVVRKSNSTVEKMLDREDIEGQNLDDVLPYRDILENIKNSEGRGSFEAVIRKNSKKAHFNFELSRAKEISSSGIESEYLIVQISDITERVELDRLKYLQEVNSNFVCGLSHRLRTPLTPILGLSSILKDQKDLQGNFKEMVEIIYGASLEMKDMVEKLLDIAMIGTNKAIEIDEKVDLTSLLNKTISSFDYVPFTFISGEKDLFVAGNYTWLSKSLKQLFAIGLKDRGKNLRVELEDDGEYVYLNLKGFRSLIDDFSALANVSVFQFDNPLTGDSDIKYLDIPLIRLILNRHNVKITVDENKSLISLRFEKAEE
jgi:PAS domain S-box-containing protein